MARIVKTYRQTLPAMRFIGKLYRDPSHWDEWFQNGWFDLIENAAGGAQIAHALYEDGDAYIGLMKYEKVMSSYWIGMFVPPETPVPEGFVSLDFPAGDAAVCWIQGVEPDVFRFEGECPAALRAAGIEPKGLWGFERYACPRYTEKDENGEIILDMVQYME